MDKYLLYTITDFAQDPDFINWVRSSSDDENRKWKNWLKENPEKLELVEKAKLLVLNLKFYEEKIPSGLADRVWQGIEQKTKPEESTRIISARPKSIVRRLMPYAAVAIFLMSLLWNSGHLGIQEYDTGLADNREVILLDGSKVSLNSESHLSFRQRFFPKKRMIKLEGEAFFDVIKGADFIVETQNGRVEVLGTSFNVYSRNKVFDVYCETGKVGVSTMDSQTVLVVNESVRIDEDAQEKYDQSRDNIYNRSEWRKGIFRYHGVKLSEVVEELERQFDLDVNYPSKYRDTLYTGSFRTVDLEKALSRVFWPLNLEAKLKGKVVKVE